jgi:hypothetical protein
MIGLIIMLIIVGAALYLMRLLPIDQTMKTVITVVVIVAAVIYVLRHLGDLGVNL